jgi:eukaryotic-like serine/threonine-protein kinase
VDPRDTETYRPDAEEPSADGGPLAAGDVLGRFVVLEKVGAGGMGEVYAARDTILDRKVAIKVLRAKSYASDARRARLLREAKALAKVIHPNVVTVYQAGEHRGKVYLVMEFVDGETLHDWLGTPRGWREIVDRFLPAGRGLMAAHREGLVHRDFKPENVLLGKDGRIRVGDFGVVGLAGETTLATPDAAPVAAALTAPGALMGTPRYMSPEQLQGARLDPRADQFAFAASLYLALYRRPPFAGTELRDLRRNVVEGRLTPPPRGSRVPRWLERIVVRGLENDPERRYPSMGELLRHLQRGPRVTGGRILVAAGAALLAGAVALAIHDAGRDPCAGEASRLAGVWDPPLRAAMEGSFRASGRPHADDSFRRAAAAFDAYAASWVASRTDACRATAVRHEQSAELLDARRTCLDRRLGAFGALTHLLAAADGGVVSRAVPAALDLEPVGCAASELLRSPPPTPERRALLRRLDEAGARVRIGRRAELGTLVDEARKTGDQPLLAEALLLEADTDPRGAIVALEEAATLAGDAQADDLAARALLELLHVIGTVQNRHTDALALRPAVEVAVRKTRNERLLARMLMVVSRLQEGEGNHGAALGTLAEATALLDPETLERARAARDRGLILEAMGREEEAIADFRRAMSIQEKLLGSPEADLVERMGRLLSHNGTR